MTFKKTLLATALVLTSVAASAAPTVLGTSFIAGAATYATVLNGTAATFSALHGAPNGVGSPFVASQFEFKGAQGGYQGVGVKGATAGEVDNGEYINAAFGANLGLSSIKFGLLFDGPEYGDVNEQVQVSAIYSDNSVHTFVLTATGATSATWTGLGLVANLSAATQNAGGVWDVQNPFGNNSIKSLSLTALPGVCGSAGGACNNQSDFTLISVTAVPEPETYAMLLAGLGLMGTIVRRRNKSKAA